jgi:hypothetical protein
MKTHNKQLKPIPMIGGEFEPMFAVLEQSMTLLISKPLLHKVIGNVIRCQTNMEFIILSAVFSSHLVDSPAGHNKLK